MTLLANFFIEGETAKGLFKAGGTLGDLSKCSDMAYCLGFISKGMYNNARKIGEIRNLFAHSIEFLDFNHSSIQELVDSMTFPKLWKEPEDGPLAEWRASDPKWKKFVLVGFLLYIAIFAQVDTVKRRKYWADDEPW